MIINDSHKFCFVHIPKCGGTSIRDILEDFDDLGGMHSSRVEEHESLGLLDYVHIPIQTLEQYFPSLYAKVENYYSIAILRDPYKRFASSVTQRLKMYHKKHIKDCSVEEIKKEIEHCINHLRANEDKAVLDARYIHFQSQSSFLYNSQGEPVINKCYLLEDIGKCELDIRDEFNLTDNHSEGLPVHSNKSVVYRSAFIKLIYNAIKPLVSPIIKPLISDKTLTKLREVVYVSRENKLNRVFELREVKDFIADYYRQDIDLYQSLKRCHK